MVNSHSPTPASVLGPVRLALLGILILGYLGTAAELLLLEHFEDRLQLVPLAFCALGLGAVAAHTAVRSRATVRGVQSAMFLSILSGPAGVWFHYRANTEFELEVTPSLSGWALFKESVIGGIPALAPGTMVLLGLIGLVWVWPDLSMGRPSTNSSPST